MNVNVIKPQGFCLGVSTALALVEETIQNPSILKPIYLLGNIIHNDIVVNKIKEKGVIVLDDPSLPKLEQLKSIASGSVIFSAHGVPPIFYKIANEKNLNIIDASCKYVLRIQENIKKYLQEEYAVIYIGTKKHPESDAVLGISDKIHFITNLLEAKKLQISDSKIYATNQTTLSIYDLKEIKEYLITQFPTILYDDKICGATTVRQQAMANQPKADLCIVVGDKRSSNTKKLVKVSEEISLIKTILVSELEELKTYDLSKIKTVNVSSGASTPKEITEAILSYLRLYG